MKTSYCNSLLRIQSIHVSIAKAVKVNEHYSNIENGYQAAFLYRFKVKEENI